MYRKYHGFLHFFAPRSQSKPTKNTGSYSVLTRRHAKKHDVFEQFFTLFQPMLLRSKNAYFLLFFCHRSSRLKKALNRAKLLNCTRLPHFVCHNPCRKVVTPKTTADCFTCKKRPPPAKADCVSASGKTRPFAPTVRADFFGWVAVTRNLRAPFAENWGCHPWVETLPRLDSLSQYSHLGVSENRGSPKSSILIGFSIINHPFWDTPIFGNIHLFILFIPFLSKLS